MKIQDIYLQKIDNPFWEGQLVASVPYNQVNSKIKELAVEMGVSEEDFEIHERVEKTPRPKHMLITEQNTATIIDSLQLAEFIFKNINRDKYGYGDFEVYIEIIMGETSNFNESSFYTRKWITNELKTAKGDRKMAFRWIQKFYDAHPFLDKIVLCDMSFLGGVDEYYKLIGIEIPSSEWDVSD